MAKNNTKITLSPMAQLLSNYINSPENIYKQGWEEFKKNNPLPPSNFNNN